MPEEEKYLTEIGLAVYIVMLGMAAAGVALAAYLTYETYGDIPTSALVTMDAFLLAVMVAFPIIYLVWARNKVKITFKEDSLLVEVTLGETYDIKYPSITGVREVADIAEYMYYATVSSLHWIEIAYGGGRSVRISPADREGFLARLEPRLAAPGIISRVDGAAPNGGKAITYGIFEGFDSDEANAVGRLSFWFSVFLMAFTVPVATAAGIYGGRIGMYVVAYLGCACMWATVFVTSRQAAKVQSHIDGHGTDAAGRRGARGRAIGYASLFASVAVLLAVAAFFIIY